MDKAPGPSQVTPTLPAISYAAITTEKSFNETAPGTAAPPNPKLPSPGFVVESLSIDITRRTSLFHEGEISAQISYRGGEAGPFPVPVEMWIDAQQPEIIYVLEQPISGGTLTPVVANVRLGPGAHEVRIAVEASQRSGQVYVESSDISVELLPYVVTEPGSILIPVAVSNEGEIAADDVFLDGRWVVVPYDYRNNGRIATTIGRLDPGETSIVEYPIKVRPGPISVLTVAKSLTLEDRTDNNLVETTLWIEYPELSVSSTPPSVTSYQSDGTAIMREQNLQLPGRSYLELMQKETTPILRA